MIHKKHYTCHYSSVVLLTVYNILSINFENILFYCNHILQIVMLLIFVALKRTYSFLLFDCSISVPSSPPSALYLTAKTSTSITASWQIPPPCTRNGEITGFKFFYKKKDSAGSATMVPINSGATLTKDVTGLDKYTEYEFQVLAFTSIGDGPETPANVKRTLQDGKMCNMCTRHASKSPHL